VALEGTEAPPRHVAEFLDGWSLASLPVSVEVSASGLRVLNAEQRTLAAWGRDGLACDAMQSGVLHVTHRDTPHETLVVSEPALEARILALRPALEALPGGNRRLGYALTCLGILFGLGTCAYLAVPGVSRLVAQRIPLEQERALGAQLEALLDRSTCVQPPAQATLESLVKRLGGEQFQVRIMRETTPNAFALPGGIILVTDRLLKDAQSPDEIAGVLAHEIEHITQRHVLAGMVRDTILTGLWSLTVGDYAGLLVIDPSTAYHIANLEFSREDEALADAGAVQRLRAAHIRHAGLAAFFERITKRYGDSVPKWLSTHPSNADRIAKLRAAPEALDVQPALSQEAFALLQRGCD
jgi:Zn-dependent protease with chaperone function